MISSLEVRLDMTRELIMTKVSTDSELIMIGSYSQ